MRPKVIGLIDQRNERSRGNDLQRRAVGTVLSATFRRHWPVEVPLWLCAEGFTDAEPPVRKAGGHDEG
jgi:hypothetical protein